MFETLLASNRAAANVLESDKKAAEGREFYDDAYFEAFAAGTLPMLEQRLNDSIAAVAAMITGAWEQAGRPAIPTEAPRTPAIRVQAIRRPESQAPQMDCVTWFPSAPIVTSATTRPRSRTRQTSRLKGGASSRGCARGSTSS